MPFGPALTPAAPPVTPAETRQWEREGLIMLEAALVGAGLVGAFRRGEGRPGRSRRVAERLILNGRAALAGWAGSLVKGLVGVSTWAGGAFRDVAARSAAALMAFRWRPRLNPPDRVPLAARVAAQGEKLARFAGQIRSGAVKLGAGLVARAAQYANSIWSTAYGVLLATARGDGYREAMRVLSVADHCTDCLYLAGLGWVPLADVTPIGDTVCDAGCHCNLIWR